MQKVMQSKTLLTRKMDAKTDEACLTGSRYLHRVSLFACVNTKRFGRADFICLATSIVCLVSGELT